MKINLKVPIYKQGKAPICGYIALRMVLEYYGDKFKSNLQLIRDVNKVLKKTLDVKRPGYYAAGLALYALDRGYDVELITYNRMIYTSKVIGKSDPKTQLKYLNSKFFKDNARKHEVKLTKEFLKQKGKLRIELLKPGALKGYLRKKHPIILAVDTEAIWDNGSKYKHYVVLRGFDGKFILNDSNIYHKDIASVNEDDLKHAWYNNNAYVILIKPKKR